MWVSEIVLEVLDLAEAERFYGGVLGFRVIARPDDSRVWLLIGDQTRLGLWRPQIGIADGRGGIHLHYAVALSEDEYDLAKNRLLEANYRLQEEFPEGGRALYVSDPDGNVVELNTKHGSGLLGG